MTVVLEKDNLVSVNFDSVPDLLAYNVREIKLKGNRDKFQENTSKTKREAPYWIGHTNKTNGDVINHALLGDAELLKSLTPKIRKLDEATGKTSSDYTQRIQVVKRRRLMDDQGDELDMDKVYAGEFDTCWQTTERVEMDVEHRLVTLFINIGGLADVDCKDSFWRSAVAVRITKELEAAGKSVKIIVGSGTERLFKNGKMATVSITVKQYNERISMERLAAMSHIGFHRTFGFAGKAVTPYKISNTYGGTVEINNNLIPVHVQDDIQTGKTKFVYVKGCTTQQGAIQALENCYSQLKHLQTEVA